MMMKMKKKKIIKVKFKIKVLVKLMKISAHLKFPDNLPFQTILVEVRILKKIEKKEKERKKAN